MEAVSLSLVKPGLSTPYPIHYGTWLLFVVAIYPKCMQIFLNVLLTMEEPIIKSEAQWSKLLEVPIQG